MAWTSALAVGASATIDEYLRFERLAEERHEYLDGLIYAMAGESPDHGRICINLTLSLGAQLRHSRCEVFSKDLKVRCGPLPQSSRAQRGLFAYPDLVVVCGALTFHDQAPEVVTNPTVLIEVLSPSTEAFDRGEKFRRYRTWLPTFTDYLLVAQDQPVIDHYHRGDDGLWALRTAEGLDAQLYLATISCTLLLAEVYERVAFSPQAEDPARSSPPNAAGSTDPTGGDATDAGKETP